MHGITISSAVVAAFLLTFSVSANSQILSSIDFTPLGGTSWGDSSVRLDFGDNMDMGTVTFSPILGGGQSILDNPPHEYNLHPYSSYNGPTTLSTGAIFQPAEEIVFTILANEVAQGVLKGFSMTVSLDSGNFIEGSVFSPRSLDYEMGGISNYVRIVTGLGEPDSVQLPTDDVFATAGNLIEISPGLYGADPGSSTSIIVSRGLAFPIIGNSFTVEFLSESAFQSGGIAFTIATPPVPEPAAALLGLIGVTSMIARRRRA